MERCMFCGQVAEMIWVHGHYQCSRCHQITVPCCNGEVAQVVERQPRYAQHQAHREQDSTR